jgi:catechol 2,3-dioxygenase-like lactoylglutathione lyase family enzyme
MARLQLALNVSDLDEAIAFYRKLLGVSPAKVRPGYANFAVADPPLKLVLIEEPGRDAGVAGALNHLGIEVETADDVEAAAHSLVAEGLPSETEFSTTCCYAVQDKVWTEDPDETPWEVYTVLADAPPESTRRGDRSCCAAADAEPGRLGAGCC